MTYEDHFSKDWESLTRHEAMARAFVLGVAAVKGDADPEELERLRRADNRAFVDLAYNAGRRERLDLEDDSGATDDGASVEDLPTATRERLSDLAAPRPEAPDAADGTDSERADLSVDVPAMLDVEGFLETRPDTAPEDQDRLDLPDFLR